MTRYVIGPEVAIRLANDQTVIRDGHQILAPTLLRSQLLSLLFHAVNRGEMTKQGADQRLSVGYDARCRLRGVAQQLGADTCAGPAERSADRIGRRAARALPWRDTFDSPIVASTLPQLHGPTAI